MASFTNLQQEGDKLFHAKKYVEAANIYEKCAIEGNDVNSQRTLAYMLENGIGVEKDIPKAAAYYTMAAAQDDPDSTINLASLYFDGKGVRKDRIRGANLLRRLLGRIESTSATTELARCYFTAEGVPFDPEKAVSLYSKALKAGESEAKRALDEIKTLRNKRKNWEQYQDKIQQTASYGVDRYGPYKSVWGAKGYIEYLRSLGEPVSNVPRTIKCDRLSDGSFLRKPTDNILKQLAQEIYIIALTPNGTALNNFQHWLVEDCLQRFVCGASPDIYIDKESGETALFPAARNNHYKLVRMLIRAKSDIKTTNNAGLTVVDVAAETKEMENILPRRKMKMKGNKKTKKDGDWATVAAVGMRAALGATSSKDSTQALFHDPIAVARKKEARSLSVYGDGKKIYHKGSREHAIIEEITKMEIEEQSKLKKDNDETKMKKNKKNGIDEVEEKVVEDLMKKLDVNNNNNTDSDTISITDNKLIEKIIKLKSDGNDAVKKKSYRTAIDFYTKAILLCNNYKYEERHILFSNRSAARLLFGEPHTACADAFDCLDSSPGWHKAYVRLGRASEAMGGYEDARDWYEMGRRCANMQNQKKEAKELAKYVEKVNKLVEKGHLHVKLASELGFDSHLFYTPKCFTRQISVAENKDYFEYISKETFVEVNDVDTFDGGRGLFASKDFNKAGEIVLLDVPYFTITFNKYLCGYCGKKLGDQICYLADDGNEEYCSSDCKDAAWDQYYKILKGSTAKKMKELRDGLAEIGQEKCPIASSFHPLAAVKIAAATLAYEDAFADENEKINTFDVPAFRCLVRPSDLGDEKLNDIQFKVPFTERYNQYVTIKGILEEINDGRFDFSWYDNVWGMLMLNCIAGNEVSKTSVESVCLMRLGSFINHSDESNIELHPNTTTGSLAFISKKKIKKGEQLFISYCDPTLSQEDKERILLTQYMIN